MKKWVRRILYVTAGLLIAAGIALYVLYRMSSATPQWYQPRVLSEAQIHEAGRLADDKVLTLVAQADAARRAELPARGQSTGSISTAPTAGPSTIELSLTTDELNAFFQKWTRPGGRDKQIAAYVSDPQIILLDNRLILAGTIKGMGKLDGRIVSLHFEPKVDVRGQVQMNMTGPRVGHLPLPSSLWSRPKSQLVSDTEEDLARVRTEAALNDFGQANAAAMHTIVGEFLLCLLNDRPASPVIFIPLDPRRGVAVRLTRVRISDETLTLWLEPLNAAQRQAMMQDLLHPSEVRR